jgi:HSP20 family protein
VPGKGAITMAIMRWDPFSEFRFPTMFPMRRMLSMMPLQEMAPAMESDWWPKIDVYTENSDLVVKAEVPEVNTADINVTLEEGHLTIQGKREREEKVEEEDYYRTERAYGSFMRSIPMPEGVKESDVKASYHDGVLEVKVKGAARISEQKKKVIPIETIAPKQKSIKASSKK